MADEHTKADAIRFYLSGADSDGATQREPADSLGGFRSSRRLDILAIRRINALTTLEVQYASGANGVGNGVLAAASATQLKYTPPGGLPGVLTTIADGEIKIIEGNDPDKFVQVRRISADDMRGSETLELKDLFENLIGFDDLTDAEQTTGITDYRSFFIKNDSAVDADNVFVWLGTNSHAIRIALETPAGDGSIQTIADEHTQPGGRTWNTGTSSGTGLSIGTLAADATIGIWIERTIGVDETAGAEFQTELFTQHDSAAVTYNGTLRGRYRVTDLSIEGFELYQGIDGEPDYTAPPYETYTTHPHLTAVLAVDSVHKLVERFRNRFNVLTGNTSEDDNPGRSAFLLSIDGAGDANPVKPSNPEGVTVLAAADGALRVRCIYNPVPDGETNLADTFVVWANVDETDPDPDIDSPATTVAMTVNAGLRALDTTFGTFLDNSPARVVVRTRRSGTPDVDSDSTDVVSFTIAAVPPAFSRGSLLFAAQYGKRLDPAIAPTSADDFIVDAGNNIFLRPGAGTVSFYADTVLIWRCIFDGASLSTSELYIPSEFDLDGVTGFAAGGNEDPIEVISYTGPDKRLGINVNGVRVMLIDVTNTTIFFTNRDGITALSGTVSPTPVWPRYTSTDFQVWDPFTEKWLTYTTINSAGVWFTTGVRLNTILTQAQIEAL